MAIIVINGAELWRFRQALSPNPPITQLWVEISEHGFRYKRGSESWSPSFGTVQLPPPADRSFECAACGSDIYWTGSAWLLVDGNPATERTAACGGHDHTPHIPTTRTSELVFRLALPKKHQRWHIVEAHSWHPGDDVRAATVRAVMYSESRALVEHSPYVVARLALQDTVCTVDGEPTWAWLDAHYDLPTLERAREVARMWHA